MSWLNFDKEEKGYQKFLITKNSVLANKGKRIVYLRKWDVDKYRGYAFPKYATIHSLYYRQLIINDNSDRVDCRDILEIGIEI